MEKLSFVVLSVILYTVAALSVPNAVGRSPVERIIGGEETEPHEFPWIVDIRVGIHYCGGAILSEEWIVTAAQCSSLSPGSYQVVAGDHNIANDDPEQQNRTVVEIIIHPNYEGPGTIEFQNDIALLKVSPPFVFNEFVQSIALPPSGLISPELLTVAGWGVLEEDGVAPAVLHKVDIPWISDEECQSSYPGGISEDMICAGEAGKDSCTGDSGGPLNCNVNGTTYLCGIVSWGLGCARPGFPGVYTETSYFTNWINPIIKPQLTFSNPIFDFNSADPAVLKLGDYYYMTLSENRETELTIFKSPILTSFRNASSVIAHKCAPGYSDLWASEMHLVDGELYIYFTMRGEPTQGGHRMYVIQGNDPTDPMAGWSDPIRIFPEDPEFGGIDGTVFKHGNGQKYYVWTTNADLWIAPMITPINIGGPKVVIWDSRLSWECDSNGNCQSEGAFFIYNRNVSYLVFSGLGTWDPDYCLGMLSINGDKDPMEPSNWNYWPEPVFTRNDEESVLGPGHASFTLSPDETETWMVYHAHGNSSHDGRIARIEKIEWNDTDGTPIFPRPHGYNTVLPVPSGQTTTF